MQFEQQYIELQAKIKYNFNKQCNLIEALTHPSFSAENKKLVRDNQRLEFLGDSVIQIVITNKIYNLFTETPEGDLTKIRAALTKELTLAKFARMLGLGDYLLLGHGERMCKGHTRDSVLCDVFEALIGAMYIDNDHDLAPAGALINDLVDCSFSIDDLLLLVNTENPKGSLQEWTQKQLNGIPDYKVLDTTGPDHNKTFTVAVYIGNEEYGIGKAGRRQTAEEIAARRALGKIEKIL